VLLDHRLFLLSTYRFLMKTDLIVAHTVTGILILISGPFSRTAVNYNAGCKTAVSNIVMATAVMITLLFLTPLFHYTPLVVLASIIIAAMLGLIDYEAAVHLWHVDKVDFCVCIGAYLGVVFGSVEIGLVLAVINFKTSRNTHIYIYTCVYKLVVPWPTSCQSKNCHNAGCNLDTSGSIVHREA